MFLMGDGSLRQIVRNKSSPPHSSSGRWKLYLNEAGTTRVELSNVVLPVADENSVIKIGWIDGEVEKYDDGFVRMIVDEDNHVFIDKIVDSH